MASMLLHWSITQSATNSIASSGGALAAGAHRGRRGTARNPPRVPNFERHLPMDIDQLAMVLEPLNLGKLKLCMRPRMQPGSDEANDEPELKLFPAELKVRGSTAPPASGSASPAGNLQNGVVSSTVVL